MVNNIAVVMQLNIWGPCPTVAIVATEDRSIDALFTVEFTVEASWGSAFVAVGEELEAA